MTHNQPSNARKPHTHFERKGTNVPTQPKAPPMPALKPATPTTGKGNE